MSIQDSAQRPATGDFLDPALAAMKNGRRPHAPQFESVPRIIVRRSKVGRNVVLILAVSEVVRPRVHTAAQPVLAVELKRMAETMVDFSKQGIETRVAVIAVPVDVRNHGIEGKSKRPLNNVQVVLLG